MPGPVLLIHDDDQAIADLKGVLARDGRTFVIATTVEEAVAALRSPTLPSVVLLSPSVESGRGHAVLEEMGLIGPARKLPVLLLREPVPGFQYPIVTDDDELIEKLHGVAPPPSVGLLAAAERALSQARTDAAAKSQAQAESNEQLSHQLKDVSEKLQREREEAEQARTERHDLEVKHGALEREHTQTQEALASLSREHAEALSRREALKTKLDAALERAQQRSEAAVKAENAIEAERKARAHAEAEREILAHRIADLEIEVLNTQTSGNTDVEIVRAELTRATHLLDTERAAHRIEVSNLNRETAERIGELQTQLDAERAAHHFDLESARHSSDEQLTELGAAHARELADVNSAMQRERLAYEDQLAAATTTLESERLAWEEQLAAAKSAADAELVAATATLERERLVHEEQLAEAVATAETERVAAHAKEVAAERAAAAEQRAAELETAHRAELAATEQRITALKAELETARVAHQAALQASTESLEHRISSARAELESARRIHRAELEGARAAQLEAAKASTADLTQARADREAERHAASAAIDAAREATDAAKSERDAARAAAQELQTELANARESLAAARDQYEVAQSALTAERERAQAAEQRANDLESRTHLIAVAEEDGAQPLTIPRTGSVSLGELARLMSQLDQARADVRVDLAVAEGTRRLWLRRGALVAAWSSLREEAIVARARRDGLIDGHDERELREVRDGSPASLVEELRQRGLVRRIEVPGLVLRFTEEIALEALSAAVCTYRLHDESPGREVPIAEEVRPLPVLAALALRRALPFEAQLELLGGSQTVPSRTRLGAPDGVFNSRELDLLQAIDGETRNESLIASSELRPERAYQALAVAKVLGLIAVGPPLPAEAEPSADPEKLLDAKYEQLQHSDYFGILGVPRTAGADDVRAARERLSHQFDPLRWSAHADAALLRRAQVVWASIEEAAKTLQDDHLRAEYARHLKE